MDTLKAPNGSMWKSEEGAIVSVYYVDGDYRGVMRVPETTKPGTPDTYRWHVTSFARMERIR